MIKYLNATDFEVRFLYEDWYEVKTPCGKEHDIAMTFEFEVLVKPLNIKALVGYDTNLGHLFHWSVGDQHLMSKDEIDNNFRLIHMLNSNIEEIIKFMVNH